MGNLEGLGPITGFVGLFLAAAGVVLALLAGVRLLFLIRKPSKGRLAVAVAAAGLVLVLCGAVLLLVEEVNALRVLLRATDRAPHLLVGTSLLLAVLAGVRAWRRRAQPSPPDSEPDDRRVGGAEARDPTAAQESDGR